MSENLFFSSLLATVMFIMVLCPFAEKIGLTDRPDHRKQHKKPTPLIGGVSIYLAILVTLLINDFQLPHQNAYLAAAGLLVCVGLVDDYKGLGVRIRMVAQVAAGLIMTEMADIKIINLGDLLFTGNIELGGFSSFFTLFAVVGGVNAFNMIDGIDGLAGMLTLVSMTALALISWFAQDMLLFNFCSIIIATIIAFLVFNLRVAGRTSASVFLGDTGSTLFGFTVCWIAISASQGQHPIIASTTVLWIIAIPLFDSVCIMLRRLSQGRSPFNPDREHLHHIMSLTGYSVNQVVMRLASYGLIMAAIGIIADLLFNMPEGLVLLCFLGLFTCHYWGISYAWRILKITRYIWMRRKIKEGAEFKKKEERRGNERALMGNEQPISVKRRALKDRRFTPTEQQLNMFYRREEKMDDPDYRKRLKAKIISSWLNLYIGSQ
ncbi:MAG: UDP-N-acetylglucosamine--undecaprenyl-phosphate N-acetylglucosaminephosphotransferase [Methylococcales bacterium]|nr:UDP-N-acetylglucosamine--undecaprenyl-phosphate N-acetylglucosaminephosphotransferase [Methylococcales bacterium]